MSFELLHRSDVLVGLGYPVLLSASNKRFLSELLETGRYDVGSGTDAAHTVGIVLGCRVLRAHDVRATRRIADIMADILAVREATDRHVEPGPVAGRT
jgi:dihydropteroate synthase